MSQSLDNIIVHTVFSTKDRSPYFRDEELRQELHRYLTGILTKMDCSPILVGGADDHVHLLNCLSRTCTAADMVKELKRGSSIWLKTKAPELKKFAWQSGYGIFSVSFSQVRTVERYVARQEEHHVKMSFQDEVRQMLRRNKMSYDERYVWD